MGLFKRLASTAVVGVIAVSGIAVAPAASASELGENSLASVLGNDLIAGNQFDNNWDNFDIVREAADAVISGIPGTPVAVLADGSVPVTAFIPTDRAFRRLVHELTGTWPSESATFGVIASALPLATIESILLYHVVAGSTIDSGAALAADGVSLATAQGGSFTVDVRSTDPLRVRLLDQNTNALNPALIAGALDINAGNKQIAHGINRVLRLA